MGKEDFLLLPYAPVRVNSVVGLTTRLKVPHYVQGNVHVLTQNQRLERTNKAEAGVLVYILVGSLFV